MPKEIDAERNQIFSYKDPRLHHLNSSFSRDSLKISAFEDFTNDPIKLEAALDEIIKFNCSVNEFNYMNDLAVKFKNVLIPKVLN